jgi:ATP-dependent exoDNAse (exonuclease V) alpha subunit
MAPTGSAANILSSKTESKARTIHGVIYRQESVEMFGDDEVRVSYGLTSSTPVDGSVLFIDESSMVAEQQERELSHLRFGSGNQLADLLRYVQLGENKQSKIVFIGDKAQLPPVGANESAALDPVILLSRYGVKSIMSELSQTVRFDNEILLTATKIRDSIVLNNFRDFTPVEGAMVSRIDGFQLLAAYLERVHSLEEAKKCVAIFYGNPSALKFNQAVRNVFVPGAMTVTVGERLLVNANHFAGSVNLFNGEMVDVTEVGEVESTYLNIRVNYDFSRHDKFIQKVDGDLVSVELRYRNLVICKSDGTEKEVKILEDLLEYPEKEVPRILRHAMTAELRMRVRKNLGDKFTKVAFANAYFTDPYFNALQVKYAYAMTCHKAQGGEWENVFVNSWTHPSLDDKTRFRWLYTAYTRASKRLIVECGAPSRTNFQTQRRTVFRVR